LNTYKLLQYTVLLLVATIINIPEALAEHHENVIDTGDTAWIITATALVLFMTIPGLSLFYGGLVNSKNVVSTIMQCFTICCMASVLWLFGAYSLAFSDGAGLNKYLGGLDNFLLNNMEWNAVSGTIPENVFFMFQMTFAIITPALIVGAYVERIKFSSVLFISGVWLFVVYAPVTHWIWGGGWLSDLGILDFAGGLVVHTTAGVSALVIAILLGNRDEFPGRVKPPHSPGLVMAGAAMLWVGWYGFNGGSALAANANAGMAILVTHIAAATASLTWMAIDWYKNGKPGLVGMVTGTIAGLATITPASGYVDPQSGFIIGLLAGSICYYCAGLIKETFKIDDSLDVFAVHGVGGMLGIVLVGFLANESIGGTAGLLEGNSGQVTTQIIGAVAVAAWSIIATYIIVKIANSLFGLRVSRKVASDGLDITTHGERGYHL
jgi:Amt family ammonium transporter